MTASTGTSRFVYALGAVCVAAVVVAFLVVGPASQSAGTRQRVITARDGVVVSTVSSTGTLAAASHVGVEFASSGTLKGTFVSVGEHVKTGQLLAELDPTSALNNLKSAEINLAATQAKNEAALQGLTPEQVHQNEISDTQSRASVSSAQRSLKDAEQTAKSDQAGARNSVAQAELALRDAEQSARLGASAQQSAVSQAIAQRNSEAQAVREAATQLAEAKAQLEADRSAAPGKLSADESRLSAAQAALKSGEAKLAQDENALVNAQNNQASAALKETQAAQNGRNSVLNATQSQSATKLRDAQSIAQARSALASAQVSLQATVAANSVKEAPPTHAAVVGAETSTETAKLSLESARQSLDNTKLYAPAEGVVASITGSVGAAVSGNGSSAGASSSASGSAASNSSSAAGTSGAAGAGTTAASPSSATGVAANTGAAGSTATGAGSSSAGAGSSGAASTGGASAGKGATGASTSGSGAAVSSGTSSAGSATPFIELTDLHGFELIVPLSESEIVHVHVGQPATVTVEALEGRRFAAHVIAIAVLSTSNGGVVSYDVTFQLDQTAAGFKPGMTATAEVVVNQEEGVNVPTSAISAGTVTVLQAGKQQRRRVLTGLAGNSSTIILSGLKAGEQVALALTSSSSATSITSRLGRGGGLGGGLPGGLGGGLGGALAPRGGG